MSVTVDLHTLALALSLFLPLALILVLSLTLFVRNPPHLHPRAGRAVVQDHANEPTRNTTLPGRDPTPVSIQQSQTHLKVNNGHINSSISRYDTYLLFHRLRYSASRSRHALGQEAAGSHHEGAMTGQAGRLLPSTSVSVVSAILRPWTPDRSNTPPRTLPASTSTEDLHGSLTSVPSELGTGKRVQGVAGLGSMALRGTPSLPGSSRDSLTAPSSRLSSLTPSPRSSVAPSTPPSSSSATSTTITSAASTMIFSAPSAPTVRPKKPSSPFFQSDAPYLLAGLPNPSECVDLQVGDGFLHTATGFSPPKYQLWLWSVDDDGCTFFRPVAVGDTRDDGKRLHLSLKNKTPRWVTDKHFRQSTPTKATGNAKSTGKTGGLQFTAI